ncbi:hypothetical protein AB0D67_13710 [Streptosporangium sp. NPDC048047]|uniref:hypothetical protein n=1 Tax=Streptosporangium sp. NPDC048047 TaxID=3155748 RepID=UPI00342C1B37
MSAGASPLSGWARERFGERADAVRRQLATSLLEAVGNAQDAQRSSLSDKNFAYGSALMTRRYEAIVEGFQNESGFQTVRPYGSPHHLVVLDGNLLLPFRYAKDDRTSIAEARVSDGRISALVRELFDRFGPAPSYHQEELCLSAQEEAERASVRVELERLPADTRLIPVAYAGNAQAGLLRLYWGEAELIDEFGRIRWLHCEPVPLAGLPSGSAAPLWHIPPATAARFDHGSLPDLALHARSPIERKNGTIFPVSSEAPEETAVTSDNEHP